MNLLRLLLSPLVVVISALALFGTDLLWKLFGRRDLQSETRPRTGAASVVIPNWNGRDLLEKYLPGVVEAMQGHPDNEVIVVDNGSSDGSAEFVRQQFPGVKLLAYDYNLGFGGGSNAGFHAASNDIVVLLNSDMRVKPDFLPPLLEGFSDEKVFAVACQIFISDPAKRREETGLAEARWERGNLRVRHREDPAVDGLYPVFYAGGGSSAFDRRKFIELGGFEEILAPFYLEDTDLGYLAWKRGWKVLYHPDSVVYHEHRGTIGKKFTDAQIQAVLKKNYLLFAWKNVHDPLRLGANLWHSYAAALAAFFTGDRPGRANLAGWYRAVGQLGGAVRARWRARSLAAVSDAEAFERTRGAHYHDTFRAAHRTPAHPAVLFVSPYPILPPVHGGAVFMLQTLRELARHCEVHVIAMLDHEGQRAANEHLAEFCATVHLVVRRHLPDPQLGSTTPHSVQEFRDERVQWLIDRTIWRHRIDVLQLEYTTLGQYVDRFRRIACVLFEHDVYFQSIARQVRYFPPVSRVKAAWEYLRAMRFELRMLRRCDRIQVCTRENREYLESFHPGLPLQDGLRAGIDTRSYAYPGGPRDPYTMLFLGSFRHEPNQVAVDWFARHVLPLIVKECPEARLLVAGSDPPAHGTFPDPSGALELLGFVPDTAELMARAGIFVCPIRSGSGVRVKLLEAFASGVPVVSTRIGAEGLGRRDGEFCRLADDPEGFAQRVLETMRDQAAALAMAARARREVERNWDMAVITLKLVESYREVLREKRRA